jgi:hypothetical protein
MQSDLLIYCEHAPCFCLSPSWCRDRQRSSPIRKRRTQRLQPGLARPRMPAAQRALGEQLEEEAQWQRLQEFLGAADGRRSTTPEQQEQELQWERLQAFLQTKREEQRSAVAAQRGTGRPVWKEENLRSFYGFIAERQRVYSRWYASAPAPWTSDPTLAVGRFANIFRFLDRESVWLCAHIIEPLRHRPADLLFNSTISLRLILTSSC